MSVSAAPIDADLRAWSSALLSRLVAEPSVTGCASGIHGILGDVFRKLGFDVSLIPCAPATLSRHPQYSPPERADDRAPPGVLATRRRPDALPRVLLFAHTDTEPVHDGWTIDPFAARRRRGRIVGLGVADDLAGVVSVLAALETLRRSGLPPAVEPVVALAPGKQGGAIGTLPTVEAAGAIDAALYVHPQETGAGLTELKTASRGVVRLELTVPGRTPEPREERTPPSADPAAGQNAAVRGARLVARLAAHPPGGGVWAVTRLDAGRAPFEVPDRAVVEVAGWFTDGAVDDRVTDVRRWLVDEPTSAWERAHPVRAELIGLRANPARCPDGAWRDAVSAAVRSVTGATPGHYDGHSASDIRFPLLCAGAPAVGIGPTAGGFYGPDEWIDEASWHAATAVVVEVLTGARP